MQSWYSLITDIFHLFSRRSNYPSCSVLDAGFEYTDDKEAHLRSAYERQEKCVLFCKLPGELRNNIYELLLVSDKKITPERELLGASKAFRQESRDEKNVFNFHKLLSTWKFEDTRSVAEEGACIFVL